ncbi:MAG: GNAT family N-acetyltransferase [Gammaproteobacteria bacterium]|nr:GNAT family N-acetyltransferase [Gammaproteobacteria bacterium]MDH5304958.1 GNAT family N-acetyltransferase [Gammaproteobacteria bacterium]MDH5322016.1 GNAT family N-acetyltransferase [Gammaproteobacteria bacterium]
MTRTLRIRTAQADDLPRLVDIYNHYVMNTAITFHTEPYTVVARRDWFGQFASEGPYRLLVAENDQDVLGYASSSVFNPREAYRSSVETTIYLDHRHTGQGIGATLYNALLDELIAEPSTHRAYGGVALPNAASVNLHERAGFVRVATYSEVGYKLGQYWDVAWFEKDLERD